MKTISNVSSKFRFPVLLTAVSIFTATSLLTSCAGPEHVSQKSSEKPSSPTAKETTNAPEESAATDMGSPSGGFMPACLNLVENDRRVEFSRTKLIVTDNGKPKSLELDSGDDVRCEKMRVIENARQPSVEIVYLTRESGTSINVVERMMAVASIKSGKWIAQPLIIERLFRTNAGVNTVAKMTVKWSEEQGRPVLTRTDLESKQTETIKP